MPEVPAWTAPSMPGPSCLACSPHSPDSPKALLGGLPSLCTAQRKERASLPACIPRQGISAHTRRYTKEPHVSSQTTNFHKDKGRGQELARCQVEKRQPQRVTE